jgi:hypothetical protein
MFVGTLKLPAGLVALITSGNWPRTGAEVWSKSLKPRFETHAIRKLAPNESAIVLYAPPFRAIQDELDNVGGRSAEQLAVHDIAPDLTVQIADFGMGSESAIALDFSHDQAAPVVIRLQWQLPSRPNRWIRVANSFDEFWTMLNSA